jgi:hypothetical protein
MNEWDAVLSALADNPEEYEREGGTILFTRHGDQYALTLTEVPTVGLSVKSGQDVIPISTYVQREILGLPRLARQIITISDRAAKSRPVSFVEGPATREEMGSTTQWSDASASLKQFVQQAEPGTTRLIELMAPAGRGKTMLLETVSRDFALRYQPDPYPIPLLLKVDLLGRYVGTIDDAIAGSLNNEYYFPGLSQKDVALSVRRRWLILALDGFDELVARVGSRDAFLRITELLDQLEGQGTVILSARESFFELYQVTTAIKTYLQPRRGSYATSVIKLERWNRHQGIEVFQKLRSVTPESTFDDLSRAFQGDEELIFHPFFITRLAQLWMVGERFGSAAGQATSLARTRYVIETFVDREAREKWIDRDGNPLIDSMAHVHLLAGIAEEMWRSGAFALDVEELRLAAQLGIEHLSLPKVQIDAALERIPTHAALATKERKGTSFLHDRFLHYFIGFRVAHLLSIRDVNALRHLLAARELGPDASEWIVWNWQAVAGNVTGALRTLQALVESDAEPVLRLNVSELAARLCDSFDGHDISLHDLEFVGDSCAARHYRNLNFSACHFWHADLTSTVFENCAFTQCDFGDILIDDKTSFAGSRLIHTEIANVDVGDERLFVPSDIADVLREKGLLVPDDQPLGSSDIKTRDVSRDRLRAVNAFVKASTKTWDVAMEEMEDRLGKPAREVIRAALKYEVMKQVPKSTSGPHKTFVRFNVDREKLMQGVEGPVGDSRIDGFWSQLEN